MANALSNSRRYRKIASGAAAKLSQVRESFAPTPKVGSPGRKPRDRNALSQLAGEVSIRTFDRAEIHQHQQAIHEQTLMLSSMIDKPNFSKVSTQDLRRMIRMYDDRFFDGRLLPVVESEGIQFEFSSRMTSVAGKLITHYPNGYEGPRKFTLKLSSTLLFQTFEDVNRCVNVTGRHCRDRLEAMQRVAEHELVHLIEMLIWNDGDCNQSRYQSIANRYFLHTDYRHDLITQRERAARKFNIRVGDRVTFMSGSRKLVGRVNRITRRATVLVPDKKGQRFSDGGNYQKYYVPLENLHRL